MSIELINRYNFSKTAYLIHNYIRHNYNIDLYSDTKSKYHSTPALLIFVATLSSRQEQ